MAERVGAPLLPANPADPTGLDRLERSAMRALAARVNTSTKAYIAVLDRIPAEPAVNAKQYTFQLDQGRLSMFLGTAGDTTDRLFLEGGRESLWFFESFVSVAYARGTVQEYTNLARQSPVYAAGRRSVQDLVQTDAYRMRTALIAAREYEEMAGLSGVVKESMARVLTDGISRGLNPREIAKNLGKEAKTITRARANMIARTEITTALRRARWDEHDDAQEEYGLRSLLMHYSALSPTTRISHATRHADLFTSEQVREWYSTGANAINCKCAQISVLVDADNKPLVPAIIERAKKTEQKMRASGRGPWGQEG